MIPDSVVSLSFVAFGIAFVMSAIFAWPILKGLIALKSRQNVYNFAPETHQKKQGTPTMGGIIILLGLVVGMGFTMQDWLLGLWVLGFGLIGFADDYIVPKLIKGKRGLGWKQKIVAQLVLSALVVPILHLPFSALPVALTAFLVLFFSNAYNFADGLDALAGSLGVLLCFGFAGLALLGDQWQLVPLLASLAGAFLPFLFLNAPPAKVFMGDVGALPIGAFFGAVASYLLLGPPSFVGSMIKQLQGVWVFLDERTLAPLKDIQQLHYPNGIPVQLNLWMILPLVILGFVMIAELVPVPMQVAYYKLTKKRLFPFTPIHHSFEVKGWPESRVVWCFVLAQLVLAVFAIGVADLGRENQAQQAQIAAPANGVALNEASR